LHLHITPEDANRIRREMGLPEIKAPTSEQNQTNGTANLINCLNDCESIAIFGSPPI
jgi:hypothetical protein